MPPMLAWARSVSLSLLALVASTSEPDDTTTDAAAASTAEQTTASPDTTAAEPTSSTAATTAVDECPNRPSGAYNQCRTGNSLPDNTKCGWTSDGGPTSVTCLSPQSGDFNVCGLRDCVDDCDCFAPPTTGTAIAGCREVFGNGGKACVLYCLNGQICPDGMQCASGTCYWPN